MAAKTSCLEIAPASASASVLSAASCRSPMQISVIKDAQASDSYFRRSDNGPLADAGIPAHTVSVTYEFPDYHAVGDEWQKLDYDNMAHVDQAVGIAVLRLVSSSMAPKWNDDASTKRFVEAAKKLHP